MHEDLATKHGKCRPLAHGLLLTSSLLLAVVQARRKDAQSLWRGKVEYLFPSSSPIRIPCCQAPVFKPRT